MIIHPIGTAEVVLCTIKVTVLVWSMETAAIVLGAMELAAVTTEVMEAAAIVLCSIELAAVAMEVMETAAVVMCVINEDTK